MLPPARSREPVLPYRNLRELLWILLVPLSYLWAGVARVRRRRRARDKAYRSRHPVWCVGNLHSGGSGKTPLVLAIASRFAASRPIVLSRGYGGKLSKTGALVDTSRTDGPGLYGDEPWFLARRLETPVYIGRDRAALAREIDRQAGDALLILDDGFQHFGLARDLDLVVVNTAYQPGDAFCLPWGDLREPLAAIADASAVVLAAGEAPGSLDEWTVWLSARYPQIPRFVMRAKPVGLFDANGPIVPPGGAPCAAFCGIAAPERFDLTLRTMLNPLWVRHFADHHAYREADVDALLAAGREASFFITTEKDWHKANPLFEQRGARLLSLRIQYEIPDEFWYFLERRLETK